MSVVVDPSAHEPRCLLSRVADDDWNQATFESYVRQHGCSPPCTCGAPLDLTRLCEECFGGGCEACEGKGTLPPVGSDVHGLYAVGPAPEYRHVELSETQKLVLSRYRDDERCRSSRDGEVCDHQRCPRGTPEGQRMFGTCPLHMRDEARRGEDER